MELEVLMKRCPLVGPMSEYEEVYWGNPRYGEQAELPFSQIDIDDAEDRLARFVPYTKRII